MNIDWKFVKFVLHEVYPLMLFITAFIGMYTLPSPFNMIIAIPLALYCAYYAAKTFYELMRMRYEFKIYRQNKIIDILKDKQ